MIEDKLDFSSVISRMRSIWLVCYGALIVVVLSGLVLHHVWVPYVAFAMMGVIVLYGNHNLKTSTINCSLMTHYTFYTLLVSALIMLVINLMNTHLLNNANSEFKHTDIPFHASLVIFPVATVLYGISLLRRGKPEYCRACKAAAGFSVRESLRRNVLHHESRLHLTSAFVISLLLSAATWAYYFLYYSNESVISPDRFFLYYMPALVFVITAVYCITRYSTMQYQISLSLKEYVSKRSQLVRFMIVRGDEVYLHELASSQEIGVSLWDTPATAAYDFAHEVTELNARRAFENITGLKDFDLRFLFNTNNGHQTVHHYAVFLPEGSPDPVVEGGWFNLYAFNHMLKAGLITRSFAYEMHRIFTITMAWKTYSREGRRLYPIKNYRPTFRLRDFKNWDVDYTDLVWISVSKNNEDRPLYRLRQFWREHVSGVNKRWRNQS